MKWTKMLLLLLVAVGQLTSVRSQDLLTLRQDVLEAHNDARLGYAQSQGIANMRQMVWDGVLAESAQKLAEECVLKKQNEPERVTADYRTTIKVNYIGQLVTARRSSLAMLDVGEVVNELQGAEYNQVIFSQTNRVGCGFSFCAHVQNTEEYRVDSTVVVCNYAPGYTGDLEAVSQDGEGCSQCPPEDKCFQGYLCSPTGEEATIDGGSSSETPPSIPVITSMSVTQGSVNGGTRVDIRGRGLSRDLFSYQDSSKGYRVLFYNDNHQVECLVENYYSSSVQISCVSQPAPEGTYSIRVYIDGRSVEDRGGRYCGSCRFRYRGSVTPQVYYTTSHGCLGDPVVIHGRLWTVDFLKMDEENPDGDVITGIKLDNSFRCAATNGTTIYSSAIDDSGVGNVSCVPRVGDVVGSFDVSVTHSRYGDSMPISDRIGLSADGFKPYLYQVHADIEGVSPSWGSTEGGTVLTITGKGFFPNTSNDISVLVGGVKCEIINVSSTEIQCRTGPQPEFRELYPGGRGILREIWSGYRYLDSILTLTKDTPGYNYTITDEAWGQTGYPIPFNASINIVQKFSGFLVPPATGRYTVDVRSDDASRVYLSTDSDPTHKRVVASGRSYTRNRWDYYDTQRSMPLDLEGGRPYYLEMLLNQGRGPWHIYLGLKYHNSTLTRAQVPAEHEVQRVIVDSVIVQEKHAAVLGAVPRVLSAAVSCNTRPNCSFRVDFNRSSSVEIPVTTSQDEMERAVNAIPGLTHYGVILLDADNSTDSALSINLTILLPPLQAVSVSMVTIDGSQTVNEVVGASAPERVTLSLGEGKFSDSLDVVSVSSNDVQEAILELLSWQCDNPLRSVRDVYWSQDYEGEVVDVGSWFQGVVVSDAEPYCGRHSLLRPRYFYHINFRTIPVRYQGFDVYTYRYVCFAYKGKVPNNRFHFAVRMQVDDQTVSYSRVLYLTEGGWETRDTYYSTWEYQCFNVYQAAQEDDRFDTGRNHRIIWLGFDSSIDDYWIDNLSITSDEPASDSHRNTPAVRPGGVYIRDITTSVVSWPPMDVFDSSGSLNRSSINQHLMVEDSNLLFPWKVVKVFYDAHDCQRGITLLSVTANGGCGQACVNESQIEEASPPISGTFTVANSNGQVTKDIPVTASAAEVKQFLEEIHDGVEFDVTEEWRCHRSEWTIEWRNRGGDQDPLVVNHNNVEGVGISSTVVEEIHGGILFRPVRGDMLRQPHPSPRVEVIVNKIPSSCRQGDCGFNYTSEVTPEISWSHPSSGSSGTVITIVGEGFTLGDGNISVGVGEADCEVIDYNDTVITCMAGPHQAGTFPVSVLVGNVGYALRPMGVALFTYQLTVSSVDRDSGSTGGGTLIRILGNGFPVIPMMNNDSDSHVLRKHLEWLSSAIQPHDTPTMCVSRFQFEVDDEIWNGNETINKTRSNNDSAPGDRPDSGRRFTPGLLVLVGSRPCLIVSSALDEIACLSPPGPIEGGVVNISVCIEGEVIHLEDAFTYTNDTTPFITGYSPQYSNVLEDVALSFSGSQLNSTHQPMVVAVHLKRDFHIFCNVTSVSSDTIDCSLDGAKMPPGRYKVGVFYPTEAHPSYLISCDDGDDDDCPRAHYSLPCFDVVLFIDSTTPPNGSYLGGTHLTISGGGFPSDNLTVTVGNKMCDIVSVNTSSITCTTPGLQRTLNGFITDVRYTFPWVPSNLTVYVGDSVKWEWTSLFDIHQVGPPDRPRLPGFHRDPTESGSLTVLFTTPGEYPYGGYVDQNTGAELRAVVRVLERRPSEEDIVVWAGPFRAMTSMNTTVHDDTNNTFTYDPLSTPVVDWVWPLVVHPGDDIMLGGTGLDGDVTVTLMSHDSETEYTCTVLTQDAYNLSCRVEASEEPPVGVPLRLLVQTASGLALVAPANRSSFIQLTPIITGVVSPQGSVLGGASITIMGYGFDYVKSVMLGNSPCTITGSDFTTITCTTPPSPTESDTVVDVSVVVMATYGEPTSADCDTSSDCSYNYTIEATPVITSLDSTSIPATGNQSVSLTGMFPDTSTDSFTIQLVPQIGRTTRSTGAGSTNLTCEVTVLSSTSLTCTLPELCAGQYLLVGFSTSVGYTIISNGTNPVISIEPEISLVTPQEGSTAGGTVVSIYGGGFSPNPGDISILADSSSCDVLSSSFTLITCVTQPHPDGEVSFDITVNGISFPSFQFNYSANSTPFVNSISPTSGNHGDLVTLSVSNVPDNASVIVTIGNIRCLVTIVTEEEINCTLGLNYVGSYSVNLWVDPLGSAFSSVQFNYDFVLSGVSPVEGSLTGMSELVITGIGFDPARSSITVCGKSCSISDSVAPPTSRELRCILPPNTNVTLGSGGQESCDVVVTSLGTSKTLPAAYTYKDSLTSTISWVEPRRGGSAGGTFITIFGSGLDGNVNVTIGTTDCAITESNSTHIICRTGASRATITAPVMVFIEGRGFAYSTQPNSTTYRYVDLWSSTFTWGGLDPPVEGDFVVVPKGQTLSIDVETPILSVLLIEGGSVLFDDNQDVTLRSEHILIVNDGLLQVGTEEEPFQHRGEIVMYGHPLSTEIPLFGAKTLAVREGTLDLHGKPIEVTWTRLSQTAEPGDTMITLQDAVDWEVGGRIVIASTSRSQRENEEAEIVAISNNGETLTISRIPDPGETPSSSPLGLRYRHISVQQTLAGADVDTSAEVGYLTRNVVVRGNRLQEWVRVVDDCTEGFNVGMFETQTCFEGRFGVEETDDQFGSQIMLHAAEQDQHLVVGRIEYVEVTHAGQAFRLGRYPIHFHLNGDVTGSYVRGCAIHRTFNRAVTIHAVNNLLVEKNVAYNILGHAYFLEDGVEEYNIIQDNLGIFVRASSSLLNVDITPATFWIVNPRNYVRRNAAAGGTHFGFWYRLEQHPTGPSATTSVCPRKIPLLEFTNNTAHSFGWYGVWVFPSYHPTAEGTCGGRTPKKAEFTNFLSWRNTRGVEFTEVGSLQLKDSIMIDNELAGVEVIDLSSTCWGEEGPLIENVIVVGHTPSIDKDVPGETFCTEAGIKLPKSDYLAVRNVTFLNFDRDSCRPIRACAHCKAFQGGYESRFSGVQFENVDYIVEWQWEHEHVCRDEDGSLTGVVGGALLPHSPLLPTDMCQLNTTLSRRDSSVCDPSIRFQRVAIDTLLPPSLEFQYLLISSGDPATNSPSRVPWRFKRLSKIPGLMAVLPLERYYQLTWENGSHLTNISYRALFNKMSAGDYLWFSHQFPQPLDIVHINKVQREQTEVVPNPTEHGNGDWHYSEAADIVYYLVEGSSTDTCHGGQDNSLTFDSYKCFFLNCIIPEPEVVPPPPRFPNETRAWSEIWGNTSLGENDDITIEPLWHVVVDVPIPRLRNIIVYGVLQLNDTMDHHIQANVIYIRGGQLIAGLPGQPFKHKVTFTLYGNIDTPEFPVPLRAPAVGSKAIGVFGQLILNGELPDTPMWTHLVETVQPGDSSLTVRGVVDWSVGDKIVVMATSYEPLEAETFDIVGISQEATQTVIQVKGTFQYKHLSETNLVQGSGGTVSYSIRAEVGLLTRRIRIQNGDPEMSDQEMFGCRVLVGFLEEDGYDYVGSAQLEGVEFSGCGQYGYTFTRDPRLALAFLFTGDTVNKSSYIHRCSFHDGYNSGVGVFGSNGLELVDNIVHNQVGHSIWMEGSGHVLSGNLAGVAHFPGLYRGVDQPENFEWTANYQLTEAEEVTLHGNVAAGGQRIGFHVRGEPCNTSDPTYKAWSGNVAHSTLHGVHTGYSDGHPSGCGLYHDFTIYSCYRYGLFVYSSASVTVRKSLFVNNKAAIHTNVIGPAALSHDIGDKPVTISNVQIMSRSVDFTCDDDALVPDVTRHPKSFGTGFNGRNGGHIGLVIPAYTSGGGLFPKFAWETITSYPAINGHTSVDDVTLANFNTHCTNKVDRALFTNPNADDAIHPISLENIRWIDTPLNNRLFIQDPPLHHVNPSDCVDMDCDGHKHTLITDVDGSFTGDGTRGTIVAKAEFEWDGDRRRGIGDYRIPKTMLTQPNGSRIPVESIYPNKGIVRGNSTSTKCTFLEEWNAYNCHSIEHRMIVLESLDADTEVRRLSPIGLGGNGYIDLLNGPQDNGWCGGYTCQERISTFYGVVATGVNYKVGLTSTNPQKFRILLLNASPSDVITLGIIYTTPQKLEVVVGDQIIQPKHTELVDGELMYKNPEDYPNQPDLFRVTLDDPHGTNYYDRSTKTLSITLTGASPIEIHTSPLVQISLFLAPITVDEFFGENLRTNLAALLNIDKRRIRVVNVIAEDSRRRKRATDDSGIQVDFEIGALPSATVEEEEANNDFEELSTITTEFVNAMQTGDLNRELNVSVVNADVETPVPPPVDPTGGVRATPTSGGPQPGEVSNGTMTFSEIQMMMEEESEAESQPLTFTIPSRLAIFLEPATSGVAGSVLDQQPKLIMLDSSGDRITNIGINTPWRVGVEVVGDNANSTVVLGSTAEFINGWANYSSLSFPQAGVFRLRFVIVYPTSASFQAMSNVSITVSSASKVQANEIALYVGTGVGGALLLIIIVGVSIIACFYLVKKLKGKNKVKPDEEGSHPHLTGHNVYENPGLMSTSFSTPSVEDPKYEMVGFTLPGSSTEVFENSSKSLAD